VFGVTRGADRGLKSVWPIHSLRELAVSGVSLRNIGGGVPRFGLALVVASRTSRFLCSCLQFLEIQDAWGRRGGGRAPGPLGAGRQSDFAVEPDGLRAFDPPAGAGNVAQIHFYVKEALAAADADGVARELFGVIAFQRQNLPEGRS